MSSLVVGESRASPFGRANRDWLYLDCYREADINVDLREKLDTWPGLSSGQLNLVFASHVLEHVDDDAALHTLRMCRKYMRRGGTLRVSVPDYDAGLSALLSGDAAWFDTCEVYCPGRSIEERFGAYVSFYRTADGHEGCAALDADARAELRLLLSSPTLCVNDVVRFYCGRVPGDATYVSHCNGYNFDKLSRMALQAGFTRVAKRRPGVSRNPIFGRPGYDNRIHCSLYVDMWDEGA
jgi:hypothetical protein